MEYLKKYDTYKYQVALNIEFNPSIKQECLLINTYLCFDDLETFIRFDISSNSSFRYKILTEIEAVELLKRYHFSQIVKDWGLGE
ncbi:hypothetical protein [Arcobacter porcinus]|uniref:Uncharacterized protein n=1 Tax=Arcobacter porcinus TaxID=1935204 RepID=A0A5C2HDP8_9BACT|nr:hypothetical protein [Arcobacter porcinus]OCL91379.1 hypothetical protein AAX27_01326 [Aliarcobacter thereius]QEP40304.1 hypothetical protein APORC_0689 [Arcobacter porcinus]